MKEGRGKKIYLCRGTSPPAPCIISATKILHFLPGRPVIRREKYDHSVLPRCFNASVASESSAGYPSAAHYNGEGELRSLSRNSVQDWITSHDSGSRKMFVYVYGPYYRRVISIKIIIPTTDVFHWTKMTRNMSYVPNGSTIVRLYAYLSGILPKTDWKRVRGSLKSNIIISALSTKWRTKYHELLGY